MGHEHDWAGSLRRWDLTADGAPFATAGSDLFPVRFRNEPAMLKHARSAEERAGAAVLTWWDGDGAARVLGRDGDTTLLERATGSRDLFVMANDGHDEQATQILCAVLQRLHLPRSGAPDAELTTLGEVFASAEWLCAAHPQLRQSWLVADELLRHPADDVVLHGDMHHRNALDFGHRGWLAIDPKNYVGDPAFDYANLLTNPELPRADDPERFRRQLAVIVSSTRIERERLLRWVVAFGGLSAAWFYEDDEPVSAERSLAIVDLARAALSGST